MTTHPFPVKQLLRSITPVLLHPAAHGHPDIPPIGRYQIDFDGFKGISEFIGGDLFITASLNRTPLASDQTEALLRTSVRHPDGRTVTAGEVLNEAIECHLENRHPDWTDEEGSCGKLDIRFVPRLRITGTITRRFIATRTSRV